MRDYLVESSLSSNDLTVSMVSYVYFNDIVDVLIRGSVDLSKARRTKRKANATGETTCSIFQ